jgi:hypothetical protein
MASAIYAVVVTHQKIFKLKKKRITSINIEKLKFQPTLHWPFKWNSSKGFMDWQASKHVCHAGRQTRLLPSFRT